jgi:hypothetical protein
MHPGLLIALLLSYALLKPDKKKNEEQNKQKERGVV